MVLRSCKNNYFFTESSLFVETTLLVSNNTSVYEPDTNEDPDADVWLMFSQTLVNLTEPFYVGLVATSSYNYSEGEL